MRLGLWSSFSLAKLHPFIEHVWSCYPDARASRQGGGFAICEGQSHPFPYDLVSFTDVLISDCEDCVILLVNCRTVFIFFRHPRFFVLAAY